VCTLFGSPPHVFAVSVFSVLSCACFAAPPRDDTTVLFDAFFKRRGNHKIDYNSRMAVLLLLQSCS
jgi:hypothetical protein